MKLRTTQFLSTNGKMILSWVIAVSGALPEKLSAASPVYSISKLGIKKLESPTDDPRGPIKLTVDTSHTGQISPYIYGFGAVSGASELWSADNQFSLFRLGGNRFTGYNWENNMSHAGSDWRYQNDLYLCSNLNPIVTMKDCSNPGGVVSGFAKQVFGVNGSGPTASILVTIPIIGYVAYKATDGDVCAPANQLKDGNCKNRDYLKTHFRISRTKTAEKPTTNPNLSDEYVNQNEFIKWIFESFPDKKRGDSQIFFSLDNEVALWGTTHNRIRPGGDFCQHNPSYSEILKRNIDYGSMVKEIRQDALVFGPVDYGWYSMTSLQGFGHCDGNGNVNFYEFYLKGLKKAEDEAKTKGPIVDILDFHWYSEVEPKQGVRITHKDAPDSLEYHQARIDATRTLWDPTFVEDTWIAKKDLGGKAIRLIPRMRETIEKWNPGMGLAITEYNYGGENQISGAIAQADILGIFGREGVFAASYWPLSSNSSYIYGAFRMFRNFDGKRSRFGDTGLASATSSPTRTSIYASIDPINPKNLVLVVLNKTKDPLTVDLSMKGTTQTFKSAEIYKLDKSSPLPGLLKKTPFSDLKNLSIPGFTIYTIRITP